MSIGSFFKHSPGKSKKYKLGIALGGGGARGFAHLGVLQALYEKEIKPEIISGTSAGSMVGALIADGKTPREVMDILAVKDIFQYSKLRWPREGFFSLEGLGNMLRSNLSVHRIEELNIPLIIAATNLNRGKVEYFDQGEIERCVIASSSIPVIFKPIQLSNSKYADGGIMDNLPVTPLINLCEKVIAVSISPIEESNNLDGILKITSRTFQLSVNAQAKELRDQCAVFIEPPGIRKYEVFDLKHSEELYELGYEHVRKLDLDKVLD